jgi:hypothetical protein
MASASAQSGYLRNSTTAPNNFVDWAALEAKCSRRFRGEIDRLRSLAVGASRAGYIRTTGPLSALAWEDLTQRIPALLREDQSDRPRAWRNPQLPTDDSLRHVRDYERGVRKLARQYLGTEHAAPHVHELIAAAGYRLRPYEGTAHPAPTGAQASTLAAHITGASWGTGATALRVAWYRATRPRRPTFVL